MQFAVGSSCLGLETSLLCLQQGAGGGVGAAATGVVVEYDFIQGPVFISFYLLGPLEELSQEAPSFCASFSSCWPAD